MKRAIFCSLLWLSTALHAAPDENARAQALFETLFDNELARSPETKGYLGIASDQHKWDDISPAFEDSQLPFLAAQLSQLRTIKTDQLDEATLLSYRLYEKKITDDIAYFQWRHHSYPVNQMYGTHSQVPSFLINIHRITSVEDAENYLARLRAVPALFEQLIASLELRREKNIIAPKFVFAHVLRDSRNVISGVPFEKGEDSTLLADFKKKVGELDIDAKTRSELIQSANKALKKQVGPAYKKLITYLEKLEQQADTRGGVWKLPDGEAFYNAALRRTTTTSLDAEAIHTIGLEEVASIQQQMREIMGKVKFDGDLQAFFAFMRDAPQFYYPATDEGRARYLAEATALIETMKGRLPELFITQPKADLIVKAVEPFREKSAGKAFYQQPAADGSRPGTYYANLYNMADMPVYQMEALAYHEGIPGHHMQISIAQEIESMPRFRRFDGYTAYIEGWGLYSEFIPKEMGLYQDPYSDFGRLAMELWRACRLVVDTGIHAKQWRREQAIQYLVDNTPNSVTDATKAIERYIVMPSQATAYKIGMIKILQLREVAKKRLGHSFDIREFHEEILRHGALPLDILDQQMHAWLLAKAAQ